MKLLVTGASGFIGRPLVNKLIEQGHTVLAMSRAAEQPSVTDQSSKLLHVQSSLQLDNNTISIIHEFAPDVLIHLAWEKIPDFSFETSFENLKNQIQFFRQVLSTPSLKKFIVTGSCWEYNKKLGECTESEIAVSGNYFTWAKNALREFLQFECLQNNINFIWSRIFYVYGPQQRKGSLIPTVIENIQNGLVPDLKTPSNSNDFIYVEDVAEGLLHFAIKNIPSGIYNLGTGVSVPVIDVVSAIELTLQGKEMLTRKLIEHTTHSSIKDTDFWADMDKTYNAIQWKPQISLEMGIKQMINF